jgi:heme-binding protein
MTPGPPLDPDAAVVRRQLEKGGMGGLAAPLIDMRHACGAAIQPMQIAALYQALSQSGAPT